MILISNLSLARLFFAAPGGLPAQLCEYTPPLLVFLLVDEKSLSSEQLLGTAGMLYLPDPLHYLSSQNTSPRDVSQ